MMDGCFRKLIGLNLENGNTSCYSFLSQASKMLSDEQKKLIKNIFHWKSLISYSIVTGVVLFYGLIFKLKAGSLSWGITFLDVVHL